MSERIGEKTRAKVCHDCGRTHFENSKWCEECFDKGLSKDMAEHFHNFVGEEIEQMIADDFGKAEVKQKLAEKSCSVELTCEGGIFECQRVSLVEERDELKAQLALIDDHRTLWKDRAEAAERKLLIAVEAMNKIIQVTAVEDDWTEEMIYMFECAKNALAKIEEAGK